MSFIGKTIFGRACGAGSKIDFFDLPYNAQNTQNKPFHFQGSKNGSQVAHRQPWASSVRLNANLPPSPPKFKQKKFPFNKEVQYE
ncbi:MAG: hypothetical protein LBC87_09545 [Fibromonadaceae bacterium]|jgi:hypothetical protein|nr:hypothetical protein [Fibromonadaceae bacterium]